MQIRCRQWPRRATPIKASPPAHLVRDRLVGDGVDEGGLVRLPRPAVGPQAGAAVVPPAAGQPRGPLEQKRKEVLALRDHHVRERAPKHRHSQRQCRRCSCVCCCASLGLAPHNARLLYGTIRAAAASGSLTWCAPWIRSRTTKPHSAPKLSFPAHDPRAAAAICPPLCLSHGPPDALPGRPRRSTAPRRRTLAIVDAMTSRSRQNLGGAPF